MPTPTQNPPPQPVKRKPTTFNQPEQTNWTALVLFALFVLLGVAGIVWLYDLSPPEHELVCDNSPHSLTGWGSCH